MSKKAESLTSSVTKRFPKGTSVKLKERFQTGDNVVFEAGSLGVKNGNEGHFLDRVLFKSPKERVLSVPWTMLESA